MSARIMVTITVQRNGQWDSGRTLTLAGQDIETACRDWLTEFPLHLERAISRSDDLEAAEGDDVPLGYFSDGDWPEADQP